MPDTAPDTSPVAPLKHLDFRMLWIAWLFANVCMWMNDVAAAWMMTSLTDKPIWVALVQTAQLARFFADGRLDRLIDCPVPFVTCPCFGGESLDTIYLTSIRDSGNLLRTDHPQGGSLMAIRGTGVRGLPEVRFNDRGL